MHKVDYAIVGFYLILMLVVGYRCRKTSANFSDYVRMGSRSTWWLGGLSLFMSSFSAITFTGIAGQAYLAGWSVLLIFWTNALMFFVQAGIFAPLLRRTRADTAKDAVRLRFGRSVEQFMSYLGTASSFVWGGLFLLSLATFCSALFQIPVLILIIVTGAVVVLYTVAGGSWAGQINDYLQGVVLMPVTIAFAVLCLVKIGGISELLAGIRAAGLTDDYAFLKPTGHHYLSEMKVQGGFFTWWWFAAILLQQGFVQASNLQTCSRYLSLKDETHSRKAALLAGILMIVGSFAWFIPPIVGRLLYDADILAVTGVSNRADAAYAITAIKLLPPGFIGLILIAMLAATMSSLDSFLTGTAGILVKNIYLPLLGALKRTAPQGAALLKLTKVVNLVLGLWAILVAILFHYSGGEGGIYNTMQQSVALVAAPTAFPMAVALLFRRIPVWGFYFGVGVGVVASVTMFTLRKMGSPFLWHEQMFIMAGATILPLYFSTFFWHKTSTSFRALVDNFFQTVNTPIDVPAEVGHNVDRALYSSIGNYVLIMMVPIAFMVFWANTIPERIAILAIACVQLAVGLSLKRKSRTVT